MGLKNKIIALFSIIIIAFGITGCAGCLGGIYFVKKIFTGISGSTQLISSASTSVESVNVLLDNSSTALSNVASTVENARVSLSGASDMLQSSSAALLEISELIEFEIIGIKPLAGISGYFRTMSEDLDGLSKNMMLMSDTVGTNVEDINEISEDIGSISVNLENFSATFFRNTSVLPDFGIRSLLYIIFSYIGILNLILVFIGFSLLVLSRQKTEASKIS